MDRRLVLTVNGRLHEVLIEPHRTLLEVLRTELGLTGTKSNCLAGECGACTVLLDGRAVNSCILLAMRAEGSEVLTVESLSSVDGLHPAQEAFVRNAAIQCGYCTPGFLMSIAGRLGERPPPTLEDLHKALEGNICRCTGYTAIRQALKELAVPAEAAE